MRGHERMLCSCKLRLRRDEPDGRLTQRSSCSSWPPSASCRRGQDLQLQRPCCGSVFFRCRRAAEEMNGLGQIARTAMLTEPPPTRLPFRNGPSGASVQHFVRVKIEYFSFSCIRILNARKDSCLDHSRDHLGVHLLCFFATIIAE